MYFNSQGKEEVTYDAIVVGSGISGGWAAKELTEKGLKTIVLERGRMIKHGDYPTANMDPWDFEFRGRLPEDIIEKDYPKQNRTGYTTAEEHVHHFVKDSEHPYNEVKRFDWMRGYQVGGRSLVWGRQSYRLSPMDFEANGKEGVAVDWPIRYEDLAPWYSYAERFAGISGSKEGLKQLPDGEFLTPFDLNCVEKTAKERIEKAFPERNLIIGRTAHLSEPNPEIHQGRGQCQTRNRCMRGCPYGAYFSSNSATLPAAERTGNLTIRPFSIVASIIHDPETGKAAGVRVIDTETKETHEYFAKVIFLCASAVHSTKILMQSVSDAFPNGIGAGSGELGHNLMDHHFRLGASGRFEGFEDQYYKGRRPTGFYIPRFRNISASTKMDFLRGYGYQGSASRDNWARGIAELDKMGADLKTALMDPGHWRMGMTAFGECLPYHENKMTLDYDKLDQWGLPTVTFDAEWKDNEMKMRKDMTAAAAEMLEAAGFTNIQEYDAGSWPGLGIHEMGTARMGRDPRTSVLNKWNQVHEVPNIYVTDGAAMTSAGCQNPSLTYMAMTARAVDHAVSELKKMNM